MLPLFTSSMRDARTATIFEGAFCCALAIVQKEQRARLRNATRLGAMALDISVSSTVCHRERSSRFARRSGYAVEGSRAVKHYQSRIGEFSHRCSDEHIDAQENSLKRHWSIRCTRVLRLRS